MSINQLYSKKVLDHFFHPRNMGELKDANGVATVGNPVCGDVLRLFIRVDKKNNKEYIKDARFQTLGCAAAISTSSVVTDLIKGKTLEEAKEVTNKKIVEILGWLPKVKIHCSLLAEEAVHKAIEDYLKKREDVPKTTK